MRLRFTACLMPWTLLLMLASSGLTAADNAERMAEMQKSLNAEVLAQPFSVASVPITTHRSAATEQVLQLRSVPRCSQRCVPLLVYPSLSLGWSSGPYRFGWYDGPRAYRYGFYDDYHAYRHDHY